MSDDTTDTTETPTTISLTPESNPPVPPETPPAPPPAPDSIALEISSDDQFIDLTDEALEALMPGYSDFPERTKEEMAGGRRAAWETERKLAKLRALQEPATQE